LQLDCLICFNTFNAAWLFWFLDFTWVLNFTLQVCKRRKEKEKENWIIMKKLHNVGQL
jgi:hypothetical protein